MQRKEQLYAGTNDYLAFKKARAKAHNVLCAFTKLLLLNSSTVRNITAFAMAAVALKS
jgi:hypothetical protein